LRQAIMDRRTDREKKEIDEEFEIDLMRERRDLWFFLKEKTNCS